MITFDDAQFSDRAFGDETIIGGDGIKNNLKFLRSKVDCLIDHKIHLSGGGVVGLKLSAGQPDGSLLPVIQKTGFTPKINKKSI